MTTPTFKDMPWRRTHVMMKSESSNKASSNNSYCFKRSSSYVKSFFNCYRNQDDMVSGMMGVYSSNFALMSAPSFNKANDCFNAWGQPKA